MKTAKMAGLRGNNVMRYHTVNLLHRKYRVTALQIIAQQQLNFQKHISGLSESVTNIGNHIVCIIHFTAKLLRPIKDPVLGREL